MSLILRGGEFVITGPLTPEVISGLKALAVRRPVKINWQELCTEDLAVLKAEIQSGEDGQVTEAI